MLPSWANDTIIRIRPGTIERRGSIEPDWTNASELTISKCSMQPASTMLSQDGRVLGINDAYTCFLPTGSDVTAGDKIRYADHDYQIIGEPRAWSSPSGRVSHVELQLERWVG